MSSVQVLRNTSEKLVFFRNRQLLVLSWNAAQVQEFDPGHRGGGRGLGQPCAPHFFFFLFIEDSQETKRKWIKEFKKDEQLKHTISYFRMWICVGDLFDHRVCWRQSNLVLSGTFLDCLNNCLSSKISDTCSLLYKFNFFGRFNHAHFHGRLTDIYEFCMR